MTKIDSTRSAIVDHGYFWRPMTTCPLGHKVQLLNPGGVACYGTATPKTVNDWRGWAPLPKIPPELK